MSQQKLGSGQVNSENQKSHVHNSNILLVGSHFKLGKRIGKGNFGEVRIGKDIKTNDDVAIKTVFQTLYFVYKLEQSQSHLLSYYIRTLDTWT